MPHYICSRLPIPSEGPKHGVVRPIMGSPNSNLLYGMSLWEINISFKDGEFKLNPHARTHYCYVICPNFGLSALAPDAAILQPVEIGEIIEEARTHRTVTVYGPAGLDERIEAMAEVGMEILRRVGKGWTVSDRYTFGRVYGISTQGQMTQTRMDIGPPNLRLTLVPDNDDVERPTDITTMFDDLLGDRRAVDHVGGQSIEIYGSLIGERWDRI